MAAGTRLLLVGLYGPLVGLLSALGALRAVLPRSRRDRVQRYSTPLNLDCRKPYCRLQKSHEFSLECAAHAEFGFYVTNGVSSQWAHYLNWSG